MHPCSLGSYGPDDICNDCCICSKTYIYKPLSVKMMTIGRMCPRNLIFPIWLMSKIYLSETCHLFVKTLCAYNVCVQFICIQITWQKKSRKCGTGGIALHLNQIVVNILIITFKDLINFECRVFNLFKSSRIKEKQIP